MIEIEAKFAVLDGSNTDEILSASRLGDFTLGPARTCKQVDRYYDTPDRDLQNAGYACRVRESDGKAVLTLKKTGSFPDGIHQREETESPLPVGIAPESWPESPLLGRIRKMIQDRPMQLLCVLHQTRKCRVICLGRKRPMELSVDEVEVEANGRFAQIREVEVELRKSGTQDDLRSLAEILLARNLKIETSSKLERALALLEASEKGSPESGEASRPSSGKKTIGLRPDDTMAKAGVKAVKYHYKRLRKSESGTRQEDDIESPHQMRVATRRLRSVMKSFGPFLPKKEVACLGAELRKATKLLGPVRDYDVLLDNLENYYATLPESERHWLDTLEATWKAPRKAARKRLIAYFDGNCYKGLNQACEAILKHRPRKSGKKGRKDPNIAKRVRHAVPRLLWEKYENVRCYENLLEGAPVEVYHQLRIECKRLRYTLELFQEVLGPDGEDMVAKVTTAQEHLGELQDADVAIELLEGFLKKRTQGKRGKRIPPEAVAAVKAYLEEREAKRDCQIETFPSIWEDLVGEDFRQHLTESLGAL